MEQRPPSTRGGALRFPNQMTSPKSSVSDSGVHYRDTRETKERTYFFLLKKLLIIKDSRLLATLTNTSVFLSLVLGRNAGLWWSASWG